MTEDQLVIRFEFVATAKKCGTFNDTPLKSSEIRFSDSRYNQKMYSTIVVCYVYVVITTDYNAAMENREM